MSEYPQQTPENQPGEEPVIDSEEQLRLVQPVRIKVQTAARTPVITYGLIGLMVLLFLGQLASEQLYGVDLVGFWGMKIDELIEMGQLWRFFTPMFLHGSITHILFNLYALYQIGRGVEMQYGHGKFLLLYIITGFTGNVFSYAFSDYPSLGSSTAIFGLLAAYGIFAWQNQKIFGQQARRTFYNVAFIAAINFFLGLSPGIDNWGHLGGFLGGILIAWFGGPKYQVSGEPPQLIVKNTRTGWKFYGSAAAAFFLFLLIAAGLLLTSILAG